MHTTIFEGKRVRLQSDRAVAVLFFSNPPSGTMDDLTECELLEALDLIDAAAALRVVILTGAQEGVFIRHYDVGVLERVGRKMAARGKTFDVSRPVPESPIHVAQRRIEQSERIFIAAINGVAMGGGCEMALACDLRIAQRGNYRIGLPEVNIGLLPGAGGTQRMARLLGQARALELILQGKTIEPDEAERIGLVSELCDGPVLAHALALAERLAAKHPRALAHVKRLVRGAWDRPLASGLAEERTLICELMTDARTIEAMTAMNQGRLRIETGE
jgi:enoyl-CoA hydratase/carnithine racemase